MSERSKATESGPIVVVGVVADPGLPADMAAGLVSTLPARLCERVAGGVRWDVRLCAEALPLNEEDEIPLLGSAGSMSRAHGWDMMICLTELPRRVNTEPLIFEVSIAHAAALVSLPALGWLGLRRHVEDTVVYLVRRITEPVVGQRHNRAVEPPVQRPATTLLSLAPESPGSQEQLETHLAVAGVRGRLRLLLGMVRHNRPWRLVPSLDSAIAAALATAAFPIFYSTIWGMTQALSSWRLAGINVFAIGAMVCWLIVHNGLWERPLGNAARARSVLYNASTALTVSLGVVCMYVVLFVMTFLAALAVISPEYMQSELRMPQLPDVVDYAKIAWMASSMGTFAGALGSSLDREEAVKQAAYSRRERERRRHATSRTGRDT